MSGILGNEWEIIEKHKIKPPIANVFTLDQIREAHRLMESNAASGKMVVVNPRWVLISRHEARSLQN
ncbi:zinc-binding dehydrogenase [Cohnella suwonensis]|uniref:Zinc-binding dehydrogenase n=1 Tax=Cohnella suwonensis TaxID=696072 RepID=A0ABW0LTB6_9BACL